MEDYQICRDDNNKILLLIVIIMFPALGIVIDIFIIINKINFIPIFSAALPLLGICMYYIMNYIIYRIRINAGLEQEVPYEEELYIDLDETRSLINQQYDEL